MPTSIALLSAMSNAEFWKQVPSNEPYRVILGDVRDKLYNTRERSRQLLANGLSDISEDTAFTNVEQVSLPSRNSCVFHLKFELRLKTLMVNLCLFVTFYAMPNPDMETSHSFFLGFSSMLLHFQLWDAEYSLFYH